MKISRRRVLLLSSLGLAGVSLAGLPQLIGRSRPSKTFSINSPSAEDNSSIAKSNSQFSQPLDLKNESTQAGLVEFSLTANTSKVKLPGKEGIEAELMTYNGTYPGPTLRAKAGDLVRIHFKNDLNEPTNLHFHGLHTSPQDPGDNPLRVVKPGETALYEFSIPKDSAGTYWYHPHHHGNVNTQLFAGLAGSIVVDGELNSILELRDIPDYLIALQDLDIDAAGKIPLLNHQDWMNGREGSLVLVNGSIDPTFETEAGTIRLRLVNQSAARYYNLQLEGHPMTVIATDGSFVNTPYPVETLLITPGERYEVLVNFKQIRDVRLVNLPYPRGRMGIDTMGMGGMMGGNSGMMGGNSGMMGRGSSENRSGMPNHMTNDGESNHMQSDRSMGGMDAYSNRPGMGNMKTQATGEGRIMTFKFTGAYKKPTLPSRINSIQALNPQAAVQKRSIKFTEVMEMLSFSLNDKKFDPKRVDIRAKLGTVELWDLVNDSDMDHPFHLHTNSFQIYTRNGKPETQPTWKDVVNVKSKETVQILVPFNDFAGITVYHCHILEHEERGMMGVVEMVPA
jgi:FtsP/CotA-like multicopper oxidase with cupredoxin domain